jgi:hypothetical protein
MPDTKTRASSNRADSFIELILNVTIAALVIDQRIGVAYDDVFDLADKDRVVSAVECLEEAALKCGERALQNRDAVFIDCVLDTGELVFDQRSKMVGDVRFV